MSKVVMSTDEFEEQLNVASNLGQAAAYENAKRMLDQKAGAAFVAGRDREADLYRKLACEFSDIAGSIRVQWMPKLNGARR